MILIVKIFNFSGNGLQKIENLEKNDGMVD